MPADLPPFRFLGSIHLLEIDAVTGMVKVTPENAEITYIQPAEAMKFAGWVQTRKEVLAQAQSRLDAEVREARRRLRLGPAAPCESAPTRQTSSPRLAGY